MVGTIRPVVYRDRQLLRYGIAVLLHILGNVASALIVGALVGLVGLWLIPTTARQSVLVFAGLGTLSIAYAFGDIGILRLPYPQRPAQVPRSWQRFHPYITALLYGLGLGSGVSTFIVTGALYIVFAGLFLSASPLYAAMSFSLFGLGRGIGVLIIGWSVRNLHSDRLAGTIEGLIQKEDLVDFFGGLVLAILGGYWWASFFLI